MPRIPTSHVLLQHRRIHEPDALSGANFSLGTRARLRGAAHQHDRRAMLECYDLLLQSQARPGDLNGMLRSLGALGLEHVAEMYFEGVIRVMFREGGDEARADAYSVMQG